MSSSAGQKVEEASDEVAAVPRIEDHFPIMSFPDDVLIKLFEYFGPVERRTLRTNCRLRAIELQRKYKYDALDIESRHSSTTLTFTNYAVEGESITVVPNDEIEEELKFLARTLVIRNLTFAAIRERPPFPDNALAALRISGPLPPIPSLNSHTVSFLREMHCDWFLIKAQPLKLEDLQIIEHKAEEVYLLNTFMSKDSINWILQQYQTNVENMAESTSILKIDPLTVSAFLSQFGVFNINAFTFVPSSNHTKVSETRHEEFGLFLDMYSGFTISDARYNFVIIIGKKLGDEGEMVYEIEFEK